MPSLRQAINTNCNSCVYDSLAGGTWREQVQECRGYSCPLFPVRPRSKKKKAADGDGVVKEPGT